jgi:propanediol dehydratase small subunit
VAFDPASDYPLGSRRPDLVRTPAGLPLSAVTLENVRTGGIAPEDVRATAETLRRQAAVALASGRTQLADNLERAAELSTIPAETILEIYTALRPHRSTAEKLEDWARRLADEWAAPRTAAFVREARAVYDERRLLAAGERAAV